MRTITDHRINPANDRLAIEVLDDPGAGGANHAYIVHGFDAATNPSVQHLELADAHICAADQTRGTWILFQNGPIAEAGVNGITQEALLAIVADRLRSFQAGRFACRENAIALTHIETALLWLHKRTMDRMSRGVEGTHGK